MAKLQVAPVDSALPAASSEDLCSSSPPSSTTDCLSPALFTCAPLFPLSALSAPIAVPPPFTVASLTQLHTRGYCVIDDFLAAASSHPPASLIADIESLVKSSAFQPGAMAAAQSWSDASFRGDLICWLPLASATAPVASVPPSIARPLSALQAAVSALNDALPGFPCTASSSQLAMYPPGGRYVRHRDTKEGGSARRLTAIVYLNEGWEETRGGQLRLWVRTGATDGADTDSVHERAVDVLPTYGRLLLFLSEEMEHEVLPATHRRLALTVWFH